MRGPCRRLCRLQIRGGGTQVVFHHRRPDIGGVDRVHPDLLRRIGDGVVLGHQTDRALGGVVGRDAADADQPGDGGQVDDRALSGRAQMRDRMFGSEEHALHVYRLHAVPLRFGHLIGGLGAAGDACVVHQHIEAAEAGGCGVDGGLHRGFVRDIDRPERSLMALCRQFGGQRLALGLQHVKDGDLGTFLGHADCTGAADAHGTPGHDGGLACKSVHGNRPFGVGL